MKIRIKNDLKISDIFIIYILLWTFVPALASGSIFRVIFIISTLGWVATHTSFLKTKAYYLIIIIALLLFTFALRYIDSGYDNAFSWTLNMAIYCIVALTGWYYIEHDFIKIKSILSVVLLATIIVSIISINNVMSNPYALRLATHQWDTETVTYGSYSYVYMCVQAVPILIFYLYEASVSNKDRLFRILAIVASIVCILLIVFSGFSLANIIIVISIISYVLIRKPSVMKTFVIILLGILFMIFYKNILNIVFSFLINITQNSPAYSAKIRDLFNQLVQQNGIGGTYSNRIELYKLSWDSIFRYPLIGSVLATGKIICGGHSTLVDVLSYGGIIYAMLYYFVILITPIKMMYSGKGDTKNRILKTLFLVPLLLTGIFDTISYTYSWVWFFFIPYVSKSMKEMNGD